jgi:hypothetical protein
MGVSRKVVGETIFNFIYLFIYLFIHLFKLSTLNEFIPAPLAETNERSSATGKGTWKDLKELIMKITTKPQKGIPSKQLRNRLGIN